MNNILQRLHWLTQNPVMSVSFLMLSFKNAKMQKNPSNEQRHAQPNIAEADVKPYNCPLTNEPNNSPTKAAASILAILCIEQILLMISI